MAEERQTAKPGKPNNAEAPGCESGSARNPRRERVKKAARAVVFLLIFFFLFGRLERLLSAKSSEQKLNSFFEEKNDFDVLFMGISHMEVEVFPMDLWHDFGFTSFNFGEKGNQLQSDYWVLKSALEYTSPKVVVIDVRRLDVDNKEQFSYVVVDYDRFPLSMSKIQAALDLYEDPMSSVEMVIPMVKYHTRWMELTKDDYIFDERIDMGAYHYPTHRLRVADPVSYETVGDDEKDTTETISRQYLRKMIELCREKNIDVVLTELPYPASPSAQRLANGVADLAEEYGVPYLNLLKEDGLVDFKTDMNDKKAHLNDSGSHKVTEYFGRYLTEHYDLPDHRDDPVYSSWEERYAAYRDYMADRIGEQTKIANVLMLLADKELDAVIRIPEGSRIYEDEKLLRLLHNIPYQADFDGLDEAAVSKNTWGAVVDNDGTGPSDITEFSAEESAAVDITAENSEKYPLEWSPGIDGNGDLSYKREVTDKDSGADGDSSGEGEAIQILVIDPDSGDLLMNLSFS